MNSLSLLSDAKYFDEQSTKFTEIRNMLDSREIKDKLESMKKLLALMSMGRDVSVFFPDVVKNVIVENTEVKKLVYMYLVAYAEHNQDLALLSINTFQRDLTSYSPRVRASAMRAMASIRVPSVVSLIVLALKSACKDSSAYVRRAAAAAVPKIFNLDDSQLEVCMEVIQELLSNVEPSVLGAALFAFNEVCPHNIELIHPHYRKICHLLADFDEWGQIIAVTVLTRYARYNFSEPPGHNGKDYSVSFIVQNDSTSANFNSLNETSEKSDISPYSANIPTPETRTTLSKYNKSSSANFYSDDDDDDDVIDSDSDDIFGGAVHSKSPTKNQKHQKNTPVKNAPKGKAVVSDIMGLGIDMVDEIPGGEIASSATHTKVNLSSPSNNVESTPSENTESQNTDVKPVAKEEPKRFDPDLITLLKAVRNLLYSPSAGVILAVTQLYIACAPKSDLIAVVAPLVRHSRSSRSVSYVMLCSIYTIAHQNPSLFKPYLHDFIVNSHDSKYIRHLKLDILSLLVDKDNSSFIYNELVSYCRSPDKDLVCKAAIALGRVAYILPSIASNCLRILIALFESKNSEVAAQAIFASRLIIQKHAEAIPVSVLKLAVKTLDATSEPQARALLVWIIGEHREKIPNLTPDVLRVLAKSFPDEDIVVKQQILNLAVKLYLTNPPLVALLFKYIMDLCKYDSDYDLRDKARTIRALFFKKKGVAEDEVPPETKEAYKALLCLPRPVPNQPAMLRERDKYSIGTLSQVLGQKIAGYSGLPPFPMKSTDPALRNPVVYKPTPKPTPSQIPSASTAGIVAAKRAETKKDAFYDDSEESEESDSDDEEDEEEEESNTNNFFGSNDFFGTSSTADPMAAFFNSTPAQTPNSPMGNFFDMPEMTSPQAREVFGSPSYESDDDDTDVYAEAMSKLSVDEVDISDEDEDDE